MGLSQKAFHGLLFVKQGLHLIHVSNSKDNRFFFTV